MNKDREFPVLSCSEPLSPLRNTAPTFGFEDNRTADEEYTDADAPTLTRASGRVACAVAGHRTLPASRGISRQ